MSKLFRAMSEVTASYYTIGIISDKNIVIKILHKIAKLINNNFLFIDKGFQIEFIVIWQ